MSRFLAPVGYRVWAPTVLPTAAMVDRAISEAALKVHKALVKQGRSAAVVRVEHLSMALPLSQEALAAQAIQ